MVDSPSYKRTNKGLVRDTCESKKKRRCFFEGEIIVMLANIQARQDILFTKTEYWVANKAKHTTLEYSELREYLQFIGG